MTTRTLRTDATLTTKTGALLAVMALGSAAPGVGAETPEYTTPAMPAVVDPLPETTAVESGRAAREPDTLPRGPRDTLLDTVKAPGTPGAPTGRGTPESPRR